MKLYASKRNRQIFYYAAPVAVLVSILVPVYQGRELVSVLISNSFVYIVLGFACYFTYKQSHIPVFEINKNSLVINDVRKQKKEISLDGISGIKKSLLFGYELTTISGDISIPLRSLSRQDREVFLSALKLKI